MNRADPMADSLDDVRKLVSDDLGLNFPPERNADLKRGLTSAARELGLDGVEACAQWLRSASATQRADLLARHLTVGETYFFRHGSLFDALEQHVLPELIRAKAATGRRLRLWSAACCTGEEAYSLAILIYRALPDLASWDVSIVGTDLNTRFLEKAREGVFGAWSFRDTPPGFRERYFSRNADGSWKILPRLRRMVRFAQGNLTDDADVDREARGADIILCRNALIYFTPEQAARLIDRLADGLAKGGWLMTAPSETAMVTAASLTPVRFPGAIVFRKIPKPVEIAASPTVAWRNKALAGAAPVTISSPQLELNAGDFTLPAKVARSATPEMEPAVTPEGSQLVREIHALANQGRFAAARARCDALVTLNKLDPAAHYIRASVLQETGERDAAIVALKRALYLDSGFVLAHLSLGNLLRLQGDREAADRHFANALELARRRPPEEVLAESDGLTAGQLADILVAIQEGQLSA